MADYLSILNLSALNGLNGITFNGAPIAGNAGFTITQGDVNGDGIEDFIIGAPAEDKVYVVYGKSTPGPAVVDLASLNSSTGFVLAGVPGMNFGASVGARDLDGDGVAEIVVGAPMPDGASGAVAVIKGRPTAEWSDIGLTIDVTNIAHFIHGGPDFGESITFASVTVETTNPLGHHATYDVAVLQVGGDGDIRTFHFEQSREQFHPSLVPVVTNFPHLVTSSQPANGLGDGEAGGDAVDPETDVTLVDGTLIGGDAPVGFDFDDDGYSDQLCTDPLADMNSLTDCGAAYVIYGDEDGFPSTFDVATECDGDVGFCVSGPVAGEMFGGYIAAIGDFNGDGKSDFVVASKNADGGEGAAWVVFGTDTSFGAAGLDLSTLTGPNGFKLSGAAVGDHFASSISAAGDVNGDGYQDFVVGAADAAVGAGKVYVIFGAPNAQWTSGVVEVASLIDGDRGFEIVGVAAGDHAAVVDPGDFNGDGFSDIGIGAPDANGGDGAAYMVFGGKPGEAVVSTGSVISQTIRGGDFGDTLNGMAGNDRLIGYLGADILDGGDDFDVADYRERTQAVVVTLNGATDASVSVNGSAEDTVRNIEGIVGGTVADTLTGDGLANHFMGRGGNDVIDGGAGSDTADFSDKVAAVTIVLNGAGAASVNGAAGDVLTNIENLIGGSGNDSLNGDGLANALAGGKGNDTLFGDAAIDTLFGNAGDDTLDGGDGADILDGGEGSDTADYSMMFGGGAVSITLNGPSIALVTIGGVNDDTLRNIENVNGGSGNDIITGDAAANVIRGGTGDDTLNGAGGLDTLSYADRGDAIAGTLDGANNAIFTANTTNEDTVRNFENVTGGGGDDTFTGDGLANVLRGGSGIDTLSGAGGDDLIEGGSGGTTVTREMLNGGAGNDRFIATSGSDGNDTIDGGADNDTVSYGERFKVVGTSITVVLNGAADATVTIGASTIEDIVRNIENVFGGLGNDNITGDGLANILTGGTLGVTTSGTGADTLSGAGGNDTLDGGNGNDTLDGGADIDTARYEDVSGGVTVSLAIAGAQNTIGAGSDTLIAIENLTGSAFADTLTGGSGVNRLEGRGGNDTFFIGTLGDTVIEADGFGTDTVNSSVTFSLVGQFAENLALSGAGSINATGNGLANTLIGNAAANVLKGGAGKDTLDGLGGLDAADFSDKTLAVVVTLSGASSVLATVGGVAEDTLRNVEGVIGGSNNDTLTGDGLVNTLSGGLGNDFLSGGAGNDTLKGDAGNDTMTGGLGNDTFHVGSTLDKAIEVANQGTDLVVATSHFTLAGNVENLTLGGTAAFTGTGNASANILVGNAGANKLLGLLGNDTLSGAAGADTLAGGAGRDRLTGGVMADKFLFDAALSPVTNIDTVVDFTVAQGDRIVLDRSVFTAAGADITALSLIKGTKALDTHDRVIYNPATGALLYDRDGTGAAAAVQFAALSKNLAITHTSFDVVA